MGVHRFPDDLADGHSVIERFLWVLKHELGVPLPLSTWTAGELRDFRTAMNNAPVGGGIEADSFARFDVANCTLGGDDERTLRGDLAQRCVEGCLEVELEDVLSGARTASDPGTYSESSDTSGSFFSFSRSGA